MGATRPQEFGEFSLDRKSANLRSQSGRVGARAHGAAELPCALPPAPSQRCPALLVPSSTAPCSERDMRWPLPPSDPTIDPANAAGQFVKGLVGESGR